MSTASSGIVVAKQLWTKWHSIITVTLILALVTIGLTESIWSQLFPLSGPLAGRYISWLVIILLLVLLFGVVGHGVLGQWNGVLIDDRNRMSLSRLQLVLWTILVLSAILAVGLANLAVSPLSAPLAVAIPGPLLTVMGISIGSALASSLVLHQKAGVPNLDEAEHTLSILQARGEDPDALGSEGTVVTRSNPSMARLSDLFMGEETGNAAQIDLSQVQMLLVTIIVVLTYAVAIGAELTSTMETIKSFPLLDPSFVTLLGVSHAGTVTFKALPHSKVENDQVILPQGVETTLRDASWSRALRATRTAPSSSPPAVTPAPPNDGTQPVPPSAQ